nr:hypothetical protein Iba_scaffold30247CG0010 [Ipomoea batatas]GMD76445.1 hypothetical protein Iba_chr13bCG10440 [Ipomoea batatas]GMD79793.1 hypothetical protein Iba_chr13dCG7370 [Ipomoea batatas]GMD81036.1 hypothetical protein Iba_chr13eCG7690 [Ipomoea batatas]GMD82570.1 hypothetical protein Iba_chr13fCG9360 [Ipomoea batatas]
MGLQNYDKNTMEVAATKMIELIDVSLARERYGPNSIIGKGLRLDLSVGSLICRWVDGYFEQIEGVEESSCGEGDNSEEEN